MAGEPRRWHVLGAGSVGCLWASYFYLAGKPVTLILRNKKTLKRYKDEGGILLTKNDHTELARPPALVIGDALDKPITHLLVTVKAHQTLRAIQGVSNWLDENAVVVLLQNGMGVMEELRRFYPKLTVLLGSTTDGIYQRHRFHVVHAGIGATWLGEGYGELGAKTRNLILSDLGALSQQVQWDQDIQERVWHKLAINCGINASTALVDCKNGHLVNSPEGNALIESICAEAEAVMNAAGIKTPENGLARLVKSIAAKTGENYSSMHQDLQNGRHTEIDYINGYLAKQAKKHDIATPVNDAMLRLVQLKEQRIL